MNTENNSANPAKGLGFFERYLTVWVVACILIGIALGKLAPGVAGALDGLAITVDGAPVVSIPIAICLFFMMYPIMVKIDFAEVLKAGKNVKPVGLTLIINWAIKPFTMVAICTLFLGTLFIEFIGSEAVDLVKLPLGLNLEVGASHGVGTVVLHEGVKVLQVPLWRSYLAGCILLGIAPCTAMVLVWGFLARGNDGHTLVMVAINSLTMLLLYGPLGGYLLGVGRLPVPWQALLLSIGVYVALPLFAGYLSRKLIINLKGLQWFEQKFLHLLSPITISALLLTLVLLFSFKGDVILDNPLTILWIAVPLFIQTVLIFGLGYGSAKLLKLKYEDAAPSAMIGASNHFEVAIATATMLFGLSSGASLATVVGVLIEVPVMLMLVRICLRSKGWFPSAGPSWMAEARAMRRVNPQGVLFLCVANSARSQIAEGVARRLAPNTVRMQSAGSHPTQLRPEAATVLSEWGIDVTTHHSKNVADIDPETVDTVITLCSEEECPVFLGRAERYHWDLPDPAAVEGDEATRLAAFRQVRDELEKRLAVVFSQ